MKIKVRLRENSAVYYAKPREPGGGCPWVGALTVDRRILSQKALLPFEQCAPIAKAPTRRNGQPLPGAFGLNPGKACEFSSGTRAQIGHSSCRI